MHRFLPLLALLTLSACATPGSGPAVGQLRLETALTLPAGAATLRLQHGRITAFNAVQEQDPFCVFELDTVREEPQAVTPATFAIVRVQRSVETFAGMPVWPWRSMRVAVGWDDGGPSHIYYKTVFRLAANPQGARALTCMSNQAMPGVAIMRHLSLRQMQEALGGIFTLRLHEAL
jgi:hypothetical protein